MRVLTVEDDPGLAAVVSRGLRGEAIATDIATNGEDAVWMGGSIDYDAILLDVVLPGIDGFEACRRLREDGTWTPVIMLTARDAVEDRVAGLDGGADDYLAKPFSFSELLARLRALARRGPIERPLAARLGDRGVAGAMPIEVDVEHGLGAQVDPLRIRQAVGNLLDNAVNHGADPIVVRARAEGQFLRLSVSDSGAGFSDDFVKDAFERFSRADRSRTRGGTGLGLAIVQAIALAHGGEAMVESGGKGASVALVIPLSHPCHQSDLASSSS